VGKWAAKQVGWEEEAATFGSFVAIAVAIYLVKTAAQALVHRRMKKAWFSAMVENVGGTLAGLVRMTALMCVLTLALSLVRSEFWHQEVARDSRFGSFVSKQMPAAEEMARKYLSEKVIRLKDVRQSQEISEDTVAVETNR
jgi:hypothetical protein